MSSSRQAPSLVWNGIWSILSDYSVNYAVAH